MALRLPFGKKEGGYSQAVPESTVPVSQVLNMRAQGANNNQIANQLRSQGFSLSQIRDAISQADIKGAVIPATGMQNMPQMQDMGGMDQLPPMPDLDNMEGMPDMGGMESMPPMQDMGGFPEMPSVSEAPPMPSMQQMPSYPMPQQQPMQTSGMDALVDELQRIIENIIEEKWKGVDQRIGEIDSWKAKIEEQISALGSNVSELNMRIDEFSKSIMSRSDEYKDTINDVGNQMEAIEKMMGKLVPSLADEIKELREVVDKIKKK